MGLFRLFLHYCVTELSEAVGRGYFSERYSPSYKWL